MDEQREHLRFASRKSMRLGKCATKLLEPALALRRGRGTIESLER